jgi:thiamine biosynthesis lipoprotein ApbE
MGAGGKRQSRIIDPRTGETVICRSSVTVVTGSASASNSLATAVSVLDPQQRLKVIKGIPGAGAYMLQ